MDTSQIKIESNVEAPAPRRKGKAATYRPFVDQMEAGKNQSFPFPLEDISDVRSLTANKSTAAKNDETVNNIPKFAVRKIDEEHARCWRLEDELKEKPKAAANRRGNRKAAAAG